MKDPYEVIKFRYVTEKAALLEQLRTAESNKSIKRCKAPKYVFVVDVDANKGAIAAALEEIYSAQRIKVTKVNTIVMKGKAKKRGRGRRGMTPSFKKAIVTMSSDDLIDNG